MAQAEYRADTERIEGTLSFDGIAPRVQANPVIEHRRRPKAGLILLALVVIAGAGLAVLVYKAF